MIKLISRVLLSITLCFICLAQLQGQGVTKVSGNIYDDETGEALAFVNVIFKGTSVGTASDLDGSF